MKIAGAVLTGGRSSRMGATKALVPVDGVPMGRHVGEVLVESGCAPIVLVGGDAGSLGVLGWPVIDDVMEGGRGPAAGVHAALTHCHDADGVVIAACDLPALGVDDIRALLRAFQASEPDVAVARTRRIQPACAVWSPRMRELVQESLSSGVSALHRIIGAAGHVVEIDLPEESLHNVNTPSDLRR